VKTLPLYRFLLISHRGPVLRLFASASAFDGYCAEFRKRCGFSSIAYQSPFVAVGCP